MSFVMRTTIAIDEELVEELMRVEGEVSRSKAIRRAIEDYLQRHRVDAFMNLAGSNLIDMNWREAEAEELRKVKKRGRKR